MPEQNKKRKDRKKRTLFQWLAEWWFKHFPPLD